MEESDGELMRRLAAHDLAALGPLYARYGEMVRAVAHRHAHGVARATVEDVCQEVFLGLVDLAPRYVEQGRLKSFLYGVTLRKLRASRRKGALHRALLGRFMGEPRHTLPPPSDDRRDLQRALAKLPEAQRDVLLLHSVEGLAGDEIAHTLGIELKTVWTRLHRARSKLRELLGPGASDATSDDDDGATS